MLMSLVEQLIWFNSTNCYFWIIITIMMYTLYSFPVSFPFLSVARIINQRFSDAVRDLLQHELQSMQKNKQKNPVKEQARCRSCVPTRLSVLSENSSDGTCFKSLHIWWFWGVLDVLTSPSCLTALWLLLANLKKKSKKRSWLWEAKREKNLCNSQMLNPHLPLLAHGPLAASAECL